MSEHHNQATPEAHPTVKTILVVEDDRSIASFIVEAINQETSHHALFAFDGQHALKMLHDLKPNLLLLDYGLPHMNGLDLYDHIHAMKELEHIPALLMSARLPLEEAKKRKLMCLQKPVELAELLQAIEKLLIQGVNTSIKRGNFQTIHCSLIVLNTV